jgi:hypothetical protein
MRKIFKRSCLKCGKKFKTFDSNKKFCTLSCEEEFRNREKDRNLFGSRILYKTCLGCGEPLKQPENRGRKKKFCCDKCRWIYHQHFKKQLGVENNDRQGT